MLYSSEQCCTLLSHGGTLLSYAAPYWATLNPLSSAASYWAKVHLAEIHSTITELRCTLMSCTLNPTLRYAGPSWATLYPTELRCSLLSYAAPCELHYSLTELPSVLVPLCTFVKCRKAGLSGIGIRVPQSGNGMLRYRTEVMNAGIPMPAAWVNVVIRYTTSLLIFLLIYFLHVGIWPCVGTYVHMVCQQKNRILEQHPDGKNPIERT